MMLCIGCKFGHNCPYFEGAEDMLHALLMCEDEELGKLREQVDDGLGKLKDRVKEVYKVGKDFDLGIDLNQCEGYEDLFDREAGDKAGGKLRGLIFGLYGLAGECRSKVGVRIPFGMFDGVIEELERYLNVLESGKVLSKN